MTALGARRATGLLRAFADAGVLAPADVHVALRLAELAGEEDDEVRLAAALAVRAPRVGHVFADLASIRERAAVDADEPADLAALPWPAPGDWLERVAASPLVAVGEEDGEARPLRLVDAALYLDRYWREERRLADDLRALIAAPPDDLGAGRVAPAGDDAQRRAVAAAVRRRFAVVAGGPGTGKTTTVARIVARLEEEAPGERLIALAAPTNTAAARLTAAVHEAARTADVDAGVRARLLELRATTLHRLLGGRPGHSRFRHHRGNRLPHDAVVVDETSMVPLSLMARLVEAVRPDARLVLVGDPGQLTSIEAGAVLGDIAGPAREEDGVVVLDRVHRHGRAIAEVGEAIRRGDGDAVVAALERGDDVEWVSAEEVEERTLAAARELAAAARAGDAGGALEALGRFRLLCAHRRGPYGVAGWVARVEARLGAEGEWYPGRPLLATANDHGLGLFNGDMGVVVAPPPGRTAARDSEAPAAPGPGLVAAFRTGSRVLEVPPGRIGAVQTAYAMTIHKSQGSQFGTAAVIVPPPTSRLLTRELLYTAVTRARERLVLAGSEEAVRAAVERPVARASGLRGRLWGPLQ